ncbi:hypothetical protein A0H81_06297 [Grifola frondosa]|uniref:Fungal-type protein kinase domain-containing protein n=1 Tax=Grifola frondosa TaxID=5627 RepID=A0A1C7M9P5_GRIFR|nr:hypothetical protein A0H81_06297 [Grifola frondosa]
MHILYADSVASLGTHPACPPGQCRCECAKVGHRPFLDSMPVQSESVLSHQPSYKDMFRKIPEDEDKVSEVDLQLLFCEAVEDRNICPGYVLHPCATEYDSRPTYWNHQRMWLEFRKKGGNQTDPFSHEEGKRVREVVLEQLRAYAEMAMDYQQRTHLYSVLVLHKFARLVRWDRSGTVVTDKFDYKAHPEILGEFFLRFAHLTDEAQGHDPTAQLVSPRTELYRLMDAIAAKELGAPFDYIREEFRRSLDEGRLRYKLSVEDKECGMRYFLVGKPQHIAGHGTRSYVAIDVEKEEFVHLKDHWRPAFDVTDESDEGLQVEDSNPLGTGGPLLEGDILAYLNKMSARNVPTVLCHGDVAGQFTTTQEVWKMIPRMPWNFRTDMNSEVHPPSTLVHYRLVEKEICRPLSEFKTSRNLVKLVYDCLVAHEDAVELASVLHRDVSAENMLMYPVEVEVEEGVMKYVWTGLLNDWKLAKHITKPAEVACRSPRTGTWQFMSKAILDDKFRQPTVQDDLESFFYVLVYYSIRYLKHNDTDVPSFMQYFFDSYSLYNGEYFCGSLKRLLIARTVLTQPNFQEVIFGGDSGAHPLNKLIATMLSWLQGRYRIMKREQQLHDHPPSGTLITASTKNQAPRAVKHNKYTDHMGDSDNEDEVNSDGIEKPPAETSDLESLEELAARSGATNLDGHRAMILLLCDSVTMDEWPKEDKLRDQLYCSQLMYGRSEDRGASSGKRPAQDLADAVPSPKRPKIH